MYPGKKSAVEVTDPTDLAELRDAGLLVEADGRMYCSEDMFFCRVCGSPHTDMDELDDDNQCAHCGAEALRDGLAQHKELRAYRRNLI